MQKYRITAIVLTLLVSVFAPQAFAKPPVNRIVPPITSTVTAAPTATPRPKVIYQPQNKLQNGALTACEVHERVIQTRADNLQRYASNMLDTFNKIATRVEEYYTTSLVPLGKTIANYDDLVSDIQKKRVVVENDLATAKSDADGFSCTGIDPKAHLTQFRVDMQEVKKALKEYRTSIKNLIVAVHNQAKPSGTPKPTGE